MATRKSQISTSLVIDPRQFKKALNDSRADALQFAKSLESIKAPRRGVLAGEGIGGGGGGGSWADMGGKVTTAKAALEGVQKVMEKLSEPQKVEFEFEAALAGLAAVQDGSETLEEQVKALSELGDKPGLGFQQVMEASVGIQSVGKNAREARDIMEEFGNAVSLSGGDKFAFAEAIESMSKSLANGKVDMEQVDVISARIKMFRSLMAGLDKSNASQFFTEVVKRMKELPRAAVTATESMSNLDDAWRKAYLRASDGKMVANVKARNKAAIKQLELGGSENILTAKMAQWGEGVTDAAAGESPKLTDLYQTSPEELARRKRVKEQTAQSEAAAKKAAAAAEAKAKADEGLSAQEELTRISSKTLEIEEARSEGNKERLRQLEQELRMMTEGKEIMEKTGLAFEIVNDHLQRRADHEKEIEKLRGKADPREQSEFLAEAQRANEVAALRSRGKNKKADELEKKHALEKRTNELMTAGGLSEAAARKMAGDEQRIQEDEEYLSRTGRKKSRGAAFDKTGFQGLDARKPSGQVRGRLNYNDPEEGMVSEWNFDALDAARNNNAKNRPLKSELDRAAGKPSIKPDATSGMTQQQAERMIKALQAIEASSAKSVRTVGETIQPGNNIAK